MKFKRLMMAVTSALLLSTAFSGCGSSDESSKATTTPKTTTTAATTVATTTTAATTTAAPVTTTAPMTTVDPNADIARIMIQTDSFVFRDEIQKSPYGSDPVKGNQLSGIDSSNAAYNFGDVTPVSFKDVEITGDGEYKVGVYVDLTDAAMGLNILGVSTNLPRTDEDAKAGFDTQDIQFTDVKLYVDGVEQKLPSGKFLLDSNHTDQINCILVNQWNADLTGGVYQTVCKKSYEISFKIKGYDAYRKAHPKKD
ncbi:MAG: hypothetical protein QM689_02300 [Oscillospiraceae bacterium]